MKEENKFYVYIHKDQNTKIPIYVGIGNVEHKYRRAYNYTSGRNKHYCNYIKKHGKPIVEILHKNLLKEEACKYEIQLIKQYGRKGYEDRGILLNKSLGGECSHLGSKHSKETREKISRANLGNPKHTQEQKDKWKKDRSGRKVNINPNHIKTDKGRAKPIGFGKCRWRKVIQCNLQGEPIKEWNSFKDILDILGIKNTPIWSNIKGITKQSHGFIWKYKEN